ncbi:CinA family protein [Bacillus sp. S34]|nr:CinA family protein [Bacillus sp. S34]
MHLPARAPFDAQGLLDWHALHALPGGPARGVLGVSDALLAGNGAVDPEVARQMATGVRTALAVDGAAATWGISTTGVAGPDPQDGKPVGTVFIGIASEDGATAYELHLGGDREAIRQATVSELLARMSSTIRGRE